jgi:hypothetical protein
MLQNGLVEKLVYCRCISFCHLLPKELITDIVSGTGKKDGSVSRGGGIGTR